MRLLLPAALFLTACVPLAGRLVVGGADLEPEFVAVVQDRVERCGSVTPDQLERLIRAWPDTLRDEAAAKLIVGRCQVSITRKREDWQVELDMASETLRFRADDRAAIALVAQARRALVRQQSVQFGQPGLATTTPAVVLQLLYLRQVDRAGISDMAAAANSLGNTAHRVAKRDPKLAPRIVQELGQRLGKDGLPSPLGAGRLNLTPGREAQSLVQALPESWWEAALDSALADAQD